MQDKKSGNRMGKVSLYTKTLVLLVNILLRLLRILPVRGGKVVYFARGLSVYGNAAAICQQWANCPETFHVYLVERSSAKFKPVENDNVIYVPLRSLKAIFHISTCRFLIKEADVASPPFYVRKETIVAQLWHAAGAFKKFGLDIPDRPDELKQYREIDANRWDFLLCSSINIVEIYAKAFGLRDLNRIYIDGLPRNDYLFHAIKNRDKLKRESGYQISKKVILFAPTFRDDHSGGSLLINLITSLKESFADNYIICVRLHPECLSIIELPDGVFDTSSFQPLEALLSFVDIMITDYSSIIFDFSCLNRPMIFYAPDLDKYSKDRDFYFGYEKFVPGPVCYEPLSVVEKIKSYNFEFWEPTIKNFQKTYNPVFDGQCSKRIIKKITSL